MSAVKDTNGFTDDYFNHQWIQIPFHEKKFDIKITTRIDLNCHHPRHSESHPEFFLSRPTSVWYIFTLNGFRNALQKQR